MTKIALAWFRQATYPADRAAQVDADRLPATWEEWRQRIEQQLKVRDIRLDACLKVEIDLPGLRQFCAGRGLEMNQAGRSAYAAAVAQGLFRPHENGDGGHGQKIH